MARCGQRSQHCKVFYIYLYLYSSITSLCNVSSLCSSSGNPTMVASNNYFHYQLSLFSQKQCKMSKKWHLQMSSRIAKHNSFNTTKDHKITQFQQFLYRRTQVSNFVRAFILTGQFWTIKSIQRAEWTSHHPPSLTQPEELTSPSRLSCCPFCPLPNQSQRMGKNSYWGLWLSRSSSHRQTQWCCCTLGSRIQIDYRATRMHTATQTQTPT